jgi:hypothetical protein
VKRSNTQESLMKKSLLITLLAAASLLGAQGPAAAHGPSDASAASALSLSLPVAVSVAASAALLVGGAVLSVVAVEASAAGTVWVLENASDGARASIRFAGRATEASAVGVGTAVVVTALSAGWILAAAGNAVCLIPNQIGAALLYNERVTR